MPSDNGVNTVKSPRDTNKMRRKFSSIIGPSTMPSSSSYPIARDSVATIQHETPPPAPSDDPTTFSTLGIYQPSAKTVGVLPQGNCQTTVTAS